MHPTVPLRGPLIVGCRVLSERLTEVCYGRTETLPGQRLNLYLFMSLSLTHY
jgi:hypothetical protein